jgi:hypothetical protein
VRACSVPSGSNTRTVLHLQPARDNRNRRAVAHVIRFWLNVGQASRWSCDDVLCDQHFKPEFIERRPPIIVVISAPFSTRRSWLVFRLAAPGPRRVQFELESGARYVRARFSTRHQRAPWQPRTAGMVLSRTTISFQIVQLFTYQTSICTRRAYEMLLRPLTCHRPVSPGRMA